MYKGIITAVTTATPNVNIPFVTELNTNNNTRRNAVTNAVDIATSGLYNIDLTLNATNVAVGDVTVSLFGDGVALPESAVSATSGAVTDLISFNIHDTIRVTPDMNMAHASIGVQSTVAMDITNAVLTIEKVR